MILLDWHAKPITLTSELPTIRLHYHKFIFSHWSGLSETKASWLFCLIIVPFKATVCERKGDNEPSRRILGADMHTVTEAVTLTWDQCSQAWQYTHGTHMNSERWIWACQGCPGVWKGASPRVLNVGCLSLSDNSNMFGCWTVICFVLYVIFYGALLILIHVHVLTRNRGVEVIKQPVKLNTNCINSFSQEFRDLSIQTSQQSYTYWFTFPKLCFNWE